MGSRRLPERMARCAEASRDVQRQNRTSRSFSLVGTSCQMCRLGLPGRKVRCVDGATNFSVKKTHVIIGVKNPMRRLWPFDVATNDAQFCPNDAQPFFGFIILLPWKCCECFTRVPTMPCSSKAMMVAAAAVATVHYLRKPSAFVHVRFVGRYLVPD